MRYAASTEDMPSLQQDDRSRREQLEHCEMVLQDVKEAILADLAAAEQQRDGKRVSPFQPSLTARCKAAAMLLYLYALVVPLSCAAIIAAAALRLVRRVLAQGAASEDPYARPPHRGTALVSGARGLICLVAMLIIMINVCAS